jgi:hypothetical protein
MKARCLLGAACAAVLLLGACERGVDTPLPYNTYDPTNGNLGKGIAAGGSTAATGSPTFKTAEQIPDVATQDTSE